MKISEEKINEIRRSINIVDIIGEYIPITQKGRNYFAVCPFHDDHNPSMSISPEKQIYTCFVCGAHGNVFNFVMNYEHKSFIEVLKKFADRLGEPLDIGDYQEKKTNNKINSMYEIYDFACKYYQNNLLTKEGSQALSYLKNRGFTDDVIKEFEIGVSLKNKLVQIYRTKKYSDELLLDSGICTINDENIIHDTFIDRIMFPLYDLEGRVNAFSGRIYRTESNAKYVNSKESDIFKKGNLLYNYHRAKESARKKDCIIIVEGFMDVIALYKIGIYNVVASMGTAITAIQAKLLRRLSSNIILCFDGDKAGEKATKACVKELTGTNVSTKIIRLKEDLDPDEFINKYGKDKFIECMDNAMSLLDYEILSLKGETNFNDTKDVANYVKNVVALLNNETDNLVKEIIIKRVSNETKLSEIAIKKMIKSNNKVVINKPNETHLKLNKYDKAERYLLFYMLRSSEVRRIYKNNKCYFPTREFRFLANEIIYYCERHSDFLIADFISYLTDKEELLDAVNKIDTLDIKEEYTTDEIMDYIKQLNNYNFENEIKKLNKEFANTIDEDEKIKIMNEILDLKVRC